MKDLEKAIEKAAQSTYREDFMESSIPDRDAMCSMFIAGAFSDEAKEFHQQGMYSKEEVKNAFDSGMGYIISQLSYFSSNMDTSKGFNKWFENNKKKL